MRRVLRLVSTWVVAVCLLLLAGGAVYQAVSTALDARRFPPPGRIVDVAGHRMHARVQGEGGPTVVFDSPLGTSSFAWALVQPEVAAFTSTIAYDRPGYGWSEAGPSPRSSGRIVEELHTLLEASGVPKPYVLVGASIGGCNVRLYAFRYPEEVAGLVLVDPAHEDQFSRSTMPRPDEGSLRKFQLASRFAVLRLAKMPVGVVGMGVLKGRAQAEAEAVGYRTAAVDAIHAETAGVELSFEQVREAKAAAGRQPLGDRPLVVLTRREEAPPSGEEAGWYAVWVALHRELAGESSRGRQVFVEKSGHFIAIDQPARVVDAIREVVETSRAASP